MTTTATPTNGLLADNLICGARLAVRGRQRWDHDVTVIAGTPWAYVIETSVK